MQTWISYPSHETWSHNFDMEVSYLCGLTSTHRKVLLQWLLQLHTKFQFMQFTLLGATDLQPNFTGIILYNSVNPHCWIPTKIYCTKMHFNEPFISASGGQVTIPLLFCVWLVLLHDQKPMEIWPGICDWRIIHMHNL